MGLIRQITKCAIKAMLPRSAFLTRGAGSAVCLTFDDGPHPEHTPRLLDALAEYNIRGTFFIVGERAQRHPGVVRRLVAEGHEVANHTWTHSEPRHTSRRKFLEEIQRTDDLIQDFTQKHCRLTRPPKGELSLGKLAGLLSLRQTVVLWNQDSRDYRMKVDAEMHAWCESYTPRAGDIVLMHDDRPFAADAAIAFGTWTQFERSQFCTVSESLAKDKAAVITQ